MLALPLDQDCAILLFCLLLHEFRCPHEMMINLLVDSKESDQTYRHDPFSTQLCVFVSVLVIFVCLRRDLRRTFFQIKSEAIAFCAHPCSMWYEYVHGAMSSIARDGHHELPSLTPVGNWKSAGIISPWVQQVLHKIMVWTRVAAFRTLHQLCIKIFVSWLVLSLCNAHVCVICIFWIQKVSCPCLCIHLDSLWQVRHRMANLSPSQHVQRNSILYFVFLPRHCWTTYFPTLLTIHLKTTTCSYTVCTFLVLYVLRWRQWHVQEFLSVLRTSSLDSKPVTFQLKFAPDSSIPKSKHQDTVYAVLDKKSCQVHSISCSCLDLEGHAWFSKTNKNVRWEIVSFSFTVSNDLKQTWDSPIFLVLHRDKLENCTHWKGRQSRKPRSWQNVPTWQSSVFELVVQPLVCNQAHDTLSQLFLWRVSFVQSTVCHSQNFLGLLLSVLPSVLPRAYLQSYFVPPWLPFGMKELLRTRGEWFRQCHHAWNEAGKFICTFWDTLVVTPVSFVLLTDHKLQTETLWPEILNAGFLQICILSPTC